MENQATDVHAFLRFAAPTALFSEQVLHILTEERCAIHCERANESRPPPSLSLLATLLWLVSKSIAAPLLALSLNFHITNMAPMKLLKLPATVLILSAITATLLLLSSNTLPKLCCHCHQLCYPVHPLTHPISDTSIIPIHRSLTRCVPLLVSKCTTACGSLSPYLLITRHLSNSSTLPTLIPLPQFRPLPMLYPSLLPLPSMSVSMTNSLFHLPQLIVPLFMLLLLSHQTVSSLYPTALPALFALVGTLSSKSILLSALLTRLPSIVPLMVIITVIFLASTRTMHRFLIQLADGGSSGIASPLLPMAPSILVTAPFALFTPPTTPDPASYIAWVDIIPLLDPTVCLFGPFSFSAPSSNPPGRTSSYPQLFPYHFWASLSLCNSRGILPPILASPPSTHSRWTRSCSPR